MIIACLQRSGTSPFSLRIDIDMTHSSDSYLESESDVSLYNDMEWLSIMSYMTWCHRFSARSNIIDDMIDRLHAVRAPLLQSLQIECHGIETEFYISSHSNIIDSDAPVLTSVWIDSFSVYLL